MRRAFTLIEVVTVLAILVILIGLLWLGARPARARACEAESIAQLRQIGVALLQYATDTDSTSVYPELHGMAYTCARFEEIMPRYGVTREMLSNRFAPKHSLRRLYMTYMVQIDANPLPFWDEGIYVDMRARLIERERQVGSQLEAVIDSAIDEFFYYPSEREIDLSLASPYQIWLAVDGSVQARRIPPPRTLGLRRWLDTE